MGNDDGTVFDAEPTNVMEFSLLFSGKPGEERDFDAERRLLRDARDLYECGRLRHVTDSRRGGHRIISADVMDVANERIRAHVTIRTAIAATVGAETITGMSCTCTRHGAPRCVHACAACFRLFYRHRYTERDGQTGRTVMPHEASDIVERYMADRLGSVLSGNDPDDLSALARGLEIITGFDSWDRWIANDHMVHMLGNCLPTVEEQIDMDTQVWPKLDEPDLSTVLPHGWFTMLEAAYERLDDPARLAKVYAVYIAQGRLPQDARYVDRLRWLLGDSVELTRMIGGLTGGFRLPQDNRMRPVASLPYEHLLREFRLSDEAIAYCESLRTYDRRCSRRLADTVASDDADHGENPKKSGIDWNTRFDDDDVDFLVDLFRASLEDRMPAFFVNGYSDPIVEDCEDLIRSAAAGVSVRCRLLAFKRFPTGKPATIARDLLRHAEELIDPESDLQIILQRAVAMVHLRAEQIARTFLIDDDVVVFAPPLDEATLQRERPRDFMEALRLVDSIDGMPLTHEGTLNGVIDPTRATDQDLEIVERALKARIERAKTETRFDDIVNAGDDGFDDLQDPSHATELKGLRECLDVQINALFGSRFSLDCVKCDDLFDPPVTVGQRNKWLRPTAGQLGVWTAMYVLNVKRHERAQLVESVHLPHFIAAKGLRTAMTRMLDHMLGVTAMLGIPRSQVDMDEWNALHLLRIDPHPEATDAHGNAAIPRPDRDFTVPYLTGILRQTHPDLHPVNAHDARSVRGATEELRMRLQALDGESARLQGFDDDFVAEARGRADDAALALMIGVVADPDAVLPMIDDPAVAHAVAAQARETYMTFWHARDENDASPADDDDRVSGHEADVTDAANMMLMLLEDAYTRLTDIAEPGYKDW